MDASQESLFEKPLDYVITSETGKLNINTLGMPLPDYKKDHIQEQLLNIYLRHGEDNEAFGEEFSEEDLTTLVQQIRDWVDEDSQTPHASNEASDYLDEELYPEELYPSGSLPPNQFFHSKEQLLMLPNMTLELYRLIEPHITVHGGLTLNFKYISQDLLQSLFPELGPENLALLHQRLQNSLLPDHIPNIASLKRALEELQQDPEKILKILNASSLSPSSHSFLITSKAQRGHVSHSLEAWTFNARAFTYNILEAMEAQYYGKDYSSTNSSSPKQARRPPKILPRDKAPNLALKSCLYQRALNLAFGTAFKGWAWV